MCHIKGRKSNAIVRWGIEAVKNLTHRGAVGADGKTGDGAGVLFQMPDKFFLRELDRLGFDIPLPGNLAVGVFFLRGDVERGIESSIGKFNLRASGWRDVPTDDDALGRSARATKPKIRQLFMDMKEVPHAKRDLSLFLARRALEKEYGSRIFISSFSSKTIVYKGLLVATNLDLFYPDLADEELESSFCLFHQRFSTNTSPDWTLAQPFRVLAHNGEINTIQGNRNWMYSIEQEIREALAGLDGDTITPLISLEESDSASLDRIFELLMLSGFSAEHAINMCVPPALECCDFSKEVREKVDAFFEYQSFLMKPWDGPAAIVFTDGNVVGAHLDRNGLRPLRYARTDDDILVMGSEAGMIDLGERRIRERGRLGPGETLSVDTGGGRLRVTHEILEELAGRKPYKKWIDMFLLRIDGADTAPGRYKSSTVPEKIAFGYIEEEIQTILKEMARSGKEMTYSMGDDTPLPALSEKPQLLFRYFRQRFSQVTNPPIDHIRERMVMSLRMNLGYKRNFLEETPEHASRLRLESPILLPGHVSSIEAQLVFAVERIPVTFPSKGTGLARAVRDLQQRVVAAVRSGTVVVILSDIGVSEDLVAIPSLLAVSASFKALHKEGLSNRASLIVETGEARDIHHIACLIGYNASAVHPYLAYGSIKELCERGELQIPYEKAVLNYKTALEDGILKVMARMGISTLNSYYGAQLFDTICLNEDFVEEYFRGTPVSLESDGLREIERSLAERHAAAFGSSSPALDYGGGLRYRKGGERHAWSPPSVIAIKNFVKDPGDRSYEKFSRIAGEHPSFIKHLLDYKRGAAVPLEEVEPVEKVVKRFFSGAMSVGSLSPEAHETIATACNRMGIRSNSGEGGEDPARYRTATNSAIKQIASGRFGVTPAYIASADELEIKIAQGAKPGEGGHLPALKVTDYIASLRHCTPGILLISPPPHHDIYSIEDLAQLIHDLKEANPKAKVCVKLVSEIGVGTVAAGVAKAYADIVQICGCEGGTGAASVSSIKNAGNYWEIGLAEAQRVLMENGLRERIRVRVDGGLRTGRDVVIAALLGAEEFGFGTATMVAAGCVMARQCHLNTCPTGIATQDGKLRGRFRGRAEDVISYFTAVAREVREILSTMGFRSVGEIIGRTDLLSGPSTEDTANSRISTRRFRRRYPEGVSRTCTWERNDNPSPSMNETIVRELLSHIDAGEPIEKEYAIKNIDRSIPVRLNYYIASHYGDGGLPPDTLRLTFRGTAGQSFGAFNHKGLSLTLIGEANDYVAKGMFGGRIVIKPRERESLDTGVIMGNTVLYGAIGGELYAAGKAGERFAVRNSGATAVVEGTGHHLCEYMTRGTVVVLGDTGYNVGAGMTGGVLYIHDAGDMLGRKLNTSYVRTRQMEASDMKALRVLLEKHYGYTESSVARIILDDFERSLCHFSKVVPV